jgi:hypothetical protein
MPPWPPTEPAIDVWLRDSIRRTYHAVLAARLNGNWFMLDNRLMMMLEDHQERGYQPIFVLDHNGVRLYVEGPKPMSEWHTRRDLGEFAPAMPGGFAAGATLPSGNVRSGN